MQKEQMVSPELVDTHATGSRNHRIALFDYEVTPTSAMGGCHLRMLAGLCDTYDFTVFAVTFDNPRPDKIDFVRIPAPTRPTILLSLVYHLLSPLYFWAYCLRRGVRFDLIQRMEVFTVIGALAYVHFCYRAYFRDHWRQCRQKGIRGLLLTLDQFVRAALLEPFLYRFTRVFVVPSHGLQRELEREYGFTKGKIQVIPNAVDTQGMLPPPSFHRERFRASLGFRPRDTVVSFIALGQFERKGFPFLLQSLKDLSHSSLSLLVVGGSEYWKTEYFRQCQDLGIQDRVVFVGMQQDVRPYLWASDAFALPSLYETFSLVSLEAAAAGLPIIVTPLNGVEEYLEDGVNGFLIGRGTKPLTEGLVRLLELTPYQRQRMGAAAQQSVSRFSQKSFVVNLRRFFDGQLRVKHAACEEITGQQSHG